MQRPKHDLQHHHIHLQREKEHLEERFSTHSFINRRSPPFPSPPQPHQAYPPRASHSHGNRHHRREKTKPPTNKTHGPFRPLSPSGPFTSHILRQQPPEPQRQEQEQEHGSATRRLAGRRSPAAKDAAPPGRCTSRTSRPRTCRRGTA